jgi:hypothetical protein
MSHIVHQTGKGPKQDADIFLAVSTKAEYIWIDGTEPSPLLRSKTKILTSPEELPIWGFDG